MDVAAMVQPRYNEKTRTGEKLPGDYAAAAGVTGAVSVVLVLLREFLLVQLLLSIRPMLLVIMLQSQIRSMVQWITTLSLLLL